MTDDKTLALYDRQANDYADLVETSRPYPRLETFIDALPSGAHVLDLGCGPGNWAARMVAAGLRVDAMDASAGMAEVARARFGLEVQVASFDALDADALYDGIWAHFSLLHAARSAMPVHLEAISRALRPGGRLLLGMKLGTGEARDRRDRFYTYYTLEELCSLLETAGLTVIDQDVGEEVGFDGVPAAIVVLSAKKS